ncbi:MAG TPA: ElyC/SanA/YdcF family protein [Agriterribacter sp.]|nr:ElyC/SanA/YdcF family protein [Agriterribacter sp.]HRQ48950.1 ElyC/SanA/YdcF family protein [Agriterribacter sp.]
MRKVKIILYAFLVLLIMVLLLIFFCDRAITNAAKGKLYSGIEDIPYNKTGLLPGTSKYLAGGLSNPYYTYRMEAAVRLLKAGKITYIIISGDNSSIYYNEPALMRADLLKAGIDSSCIYSDYAGFRTFDSMVRLKAIFGQDSVTVISQPFQNERAIYIASREGIAAIGFNARDVDARGGFKVQLREKLARVKVFIDYLLGAEPKFLGEKVNIP